MAFILIIADTNVLVNYEKKIIINIYIDNVIYIVKKLQLFDNLKLNLKKNLK